MDYKDIKFDFEKSVSKSIDKIENLKKESAFTVITQGLPITDSIAIKSYDEENKFRCKFYLKSIYGQEYLHDMEKFGFKQNLVLDRSGYKYLLNKNSVLCTSISLSIPQIIETRLTDFQSENFDKSYFRLVIPTEHEVDLETFECRICKIGDSITFCGLVEVVIQDRKYHLFKYNNRDTKKYYLVIDSITSTNFEEFKINSDSIILAFGFFTGDLFLDEYFYLSSENEKFDLSANIRYLSKKKSILTGAKLFNSLRFREYLKSMKKEDLYKKYPDYLESTVFNLMCYKLLHDESFSSAILLILEGTQTSYTTLRCGIYSIALETLTNIIYEENKDRVNPIPDKKLAKLMREKMNSVLGEYESFLSL